MAQKPRTQVDVPFGKAPLRPTIQGAGRNQVFVAPLPRQTSAQVLAKNLSQFSNVLGQFSNVQKQRGREAAMALTNEEVIAQIDGSNPRRFNPFDKIGFQKQFSEDVYARGFDLKIKPQLTQLGNDIKRMGVERVPDAIALDKVITEGLDKINQEALESVGDDDFQKYAHNVLFSNAAASFRASTNESWNFDRQQYLKDASAEGAGRSLESFVDNPVIPVGKVVVQPKHRATAYGGASIDPTTAEDQEKADRGVPGYEGFSQTVGASGRKLIPGYSVASNYYPQGTILDIDGKEYRVDDTGGMALNVVDFYAGDDKEMYDSFAKKKIKSVKVVDPSSKSGDNIKEGVQSWVSSIDEKLANSGHTTTGARKAVIRKAVDDVVMKHAMEGDFIKAREIADSLEDSTANNVPIFKGDDYVPSLLRKIQNEEEAQTAANAKEHPNAVEEYFRNQISPEINALKKTQAETSREANLFIEPLGEEPFETYIEKLINKPNEEWLKEKWTLGSETRVNLLREKLSDYLVEEGNKIDSAMEKLLPDGDTGYLLDTYVDSTSIENIYKGKANYADYFTEDLKTERLTLKPNYANHLRLLLNRETIAFNAKMRAKGRALVRDVSINNQERETIMRGYANDQAEFTRNKIQRDFDGFIKNDTSTPDKTTSSKSSLLEKTTEMFDRGGATEEEAEKLARGRLLRDPDTFPAYKDNTPDATLEANFGWRDTGKNNNYEKDDYDRYNDLKNKTQNAGLFKEEKSIDVFFVDRRRIIRKSDFVPKLIEIIQTGKLGEASSSDYISGFSTGVTFDEEQVFERKAEMFDLISEAGVEVDEAISGNINVGESSYNVRRIIKENWSAMPILLWQDITSYEENPKNNNFIIEDIIRANDLDITVDTFVKAQKAIFKRNITPNNQKEQ
tara:strand:- start:765 stop:3482 length:2718 start_codon:yes stop_codon:yes gene_type:complete